MATDGRSGDPEHVAANLLSEPWISNARSRAIILCSAFALSLVVGLGSIGIWGAREERLAACVADIARHGHWLIPDLWGRSRLEKPPLPYWASAATAIATGELNEWTLRAPALLAALLILSSVYFLGTDAGGPHLGLLAALFLLSSFYFVSELRQPSSDLYLTAFSAAAMACWWRGWHDDAGRLLWWSLAGLSVGLAGMCKGPAVLAIIGPPIMAVLAWERKLAVPRSRTAWTAIALAIGVSLAWPAAVLVSEPNAWRIWLRQQEIKVVHSSALWRVVTDPQFYLLKWPEYLFPWSVLAIAGIRWGFARRSSAVPAVVRFAWWWFFGDLLLFTLFTARKNYYLMPAVPGLAVLAAYTARCVTSDATSRWTRLSNRVSHHAQISLFVVTGCILTCVAWTRLEQTRWLAVAGSVAFTLLSVLVFARSFVRPRQLSLYVAAGLSVCVTIGATYTLVLPAFDEGRCNRELARRLAELVPENSAIYFWGEPDPAIWFYLDRELRPVNRLPDDAEHASSAFCLVKQRHLKLEPDLASRLEPVVTETNRDDSAKHVLARLALPLEPGTSVYTEPDPFVRHYNQVRPKPERAAAKTNDTPNAAGNLNR